MLREQLEIIQSSSLDQEQKRLQVSLLSIDAIVDHTKFMVGLGWKSPTGVNYKLRKVSGSIINSTPMLVFYVTRTKPNKSFDPIDQLRVLNPPLGKGGFFLDEMDLTQKLSYMKDLITESGD